MDKSNIAFFQLEGSVFHFPKVLDVFFSYLNAFRPKDITTSQSLEGFEQSHLTFHLEPDDVIAKYSANCNIFSLFLF